MSFWMSNHKKITDGKNTFTLNSIKFDTQKKCCNNATRNSFILVHKVVCAVGWAIVQL